MKLQHIFMHLITVGILCISGYAGERADVRQGNQDDRIVDGIRKGSLTRGEALKLKKEQKHIDALERKMLKDGELSRKEKNRLERRQDLASRHIYREKHDRQMRGGKTMHKSDRRQRRRIAQGTKSGELTKGEVKSLVNGQKKIHKAERRAMEDGKLTNREKARIRKMKEKESQKIYRKKHNKKKR